MLAIQRKQQQTLELCPHGGNPEGIPRAYFLRVFCSKSLAEGYLALSLALGFPIHCDTLVTRIGYHGTSDSSNFWVSSEVGLLELPGHYAISSKQ